MANGAPTVSNGLVISGVTTSTTFSGSGASLTNLPSAQLTGALPALDGSNLTGITQTTINNNGSNRIITGSSTANTLEGEATFTYDGVNKAKIDTSQTYAMLQFDGNNGGSIEFYANGTRKFEIYGIDAGIEIYDREKGSYHSKFLSGGDLEVSDGKVHIKGSGELLRLQTNASGGGQCYIDFDDETGTRASIGMRGSSSDTLTLAALNGSMRFDVQNQAQAVNITTDGHTLFSGLTTKNDPRNAKGITVKSTDGVSFQNYGSNGSRNWRIRPDDQSRWGDLDFSVSPTANSATDWPDAAADKVLTLGYDGQVSKPRQASFAAVNTSNGYALNGQVFPFNDTTHNIGSHYNTSNYRFTAPVAGRYLFTFYSIYNSSGQGRYEILINGAADQKGTRVHMNNHNTNWDNTSTTWILNLAENDYIQMYSQTNTGWHGNHWQRFCGELLS